MGARILVINDTQEILDLFEDLLSEEGYEVVLCSFAIQDMDEIDRIKPDLVIVDYIFGTEKTGWQLLQKLKMRRSTNTIPVIICTAATREARDIEGYLAAKEVQLVAKPFDIDDLLIAVRNGLSRSGHTAEIQDNQAQNAQRVKQGEREDGEQS